MRQGTRFTPSGPCRHERGVALFRAQSGPICTIEVMFYDARVCAVPSILPPAPPTHPPSVMLQPASRASIRPGDPGLTNSASRRSRWVRPEHRPAASRAAVLPTEFCDSDAPGRGLCRPGPEAQRQARPVKSDSMTWMRPVAVRAGPAQFPLAGPTRTVDSDVSERAGEATEKEITSQARRRHD